ncbi:MAG: nitronate monooxygenase [Gammaproteobacteria bacterium]|nr:nitronate monooxygenase [Gammaproteobacteria bacterium]
MAGACPPALSVAVAKAGGAGACGALLMSAAEMASWAAAVRRDTDGPFQINLWIPDAAPHRDSGQEARIRDFLAQWGPPVPADAGDAVPLDFASQCDALLDLRPAVASSIMGLFPARVVDALNEKGIAWFATVTTVDEAKRAAAAGADGIVAQGAEAGGHRGTFDARLAERQLIGLTALVPQVVDAVDVPVIATGGIADARGIAAALMLGASAVQIGTGLLRCPEAGLPPAWSQALATTQPEHTMLTRAFSGRAGRSIATDYVLAAASSSAPEPAPYPVQRGLTAAMRTDAVARDHLQSMQAWAGQAASLAIARPAMDVVAKLWSGTEQLLGLAHRDAG